MNSKASQTNSMDQIPILFEGGAYICGEESAMIESIEGKEGFPSQTPFVSKVGLFGKPTLNHNIETVFWVPDIVKNGYKWYSSQESLVKGPHSYSVSGRVKKPGVKLAPAGITMNELLMTTAAV